MKTFITAALLGLARLAAPSLAQAHGYGHGYGHGGYHHHYGYPRHYHHSHRWPLSDPEKRQARTAPADPARAAQAPLA